MVILDFKPKDDYEQIILNAIDENFNFDLIFSESLKCKFTE